MSSIITTVEEFRFRFAHHSHVEQHEHPGPPTVDDVGRPQPHEHYEDHEVAMVVVTNAVEHPGFGGAKVKEYSQLLVYTLSHRYRALWLRNWYKNSKKRATHNTINYRIRQ